MAKENFKDIARVAPTLAGLLTASSSVAALLIPVFRVWVGPFLGLGGMITEEAAYAISYQARKAELQEQKISVKFLRENKPQITIAQTDLPEFLRLYCG